MTKLVLVTRPLEQSRLFASDVRAIGYHPLISPLLSIESYPFSYEELIRPDTLILSSAHALGSVPVPDDWVNIPVLCVGEATESVARRAGFIHTLSARGGMEDLLPFIQERGNQRFLYLRGKDVAFDLSRNFPDQSLDEKITYSANAAENFPSDVLDLFDQIEFITLFSQRSGMVLKNLMEKNGLVSYAKSIKLLCLSSSVIESVKEMNWKSCGIADSPNSVSMIRLMERCRDE